MSTNIPMLRFGGGHFSHMEMPKWLEEANRTDEEELFGWAETLEKFGLFRCIYTQCDGSYDQFLDIDIYESNGTGEVDDYYAEIFGPRGLLWRAVFSVLDFPDFFARFAIPILGASAAISCTLHTEVLTSAMLAIGNEVHDLDLDPSGTSARERLRFLSKLAKRPAKPPAVGGA